MDMRRIRHARKTAAPRRSAATCFVAAVLAAAAVVPGATMAAEVAVATTADQVIIGDELLVGFVCNTHLATIADVEAARWEINPENGDEVLCVDLRPVEVWTGQDVPSLTLLVTGMPGRTCRSGLDATRPAAIEVGGRYLFLCKRHWSVDLKAYTDRYIVPFLGI
ncbi:MAG TPA: hypothetical protein PLQ13_09405, partial [Candidatus Krumholzibacteria bacterium]|nr:hypothetical protein [Candidatus Krumholzibacteria bacterium]